MVLSRSNRASGSRRQGALCTSQRLAAFRQVRVDFVAHGVAGLSGADRQALTEALPALRALLAALDVEEGR